MTVNEVMEQYVNPIFTNKVSLIIIGALIAFLFVIFSKKVISTFFGRTNFIDEKKERTIESMLNSIIKYIATFGFIIYLLGILGIEVGKILAGAGVLGIILGFGAQSLIKDLLAGIFLLYEKQLHQGDWIKVNNTYEGVVEDIGLRFLKIREWSGVLVTLSNGQITAIENYNMDKMRVIENITVSFYEDPKKVFYLLEKVCVRLNDELGHYLLTDLDGKPLEPFALFGVSSLNNQFRGYQYTVTGFCVDHFYFTAAKETRRIIAETLFEEKIQMAEQHIDMRQSESK
ncbi:mechanosensitive ion channel family protein [Aquibacillus rhizosphaerae]|uniref:Mechanosensitive ion channel n=1 Tax=Aquibacillus rhizosphaerae TaxID=3051431 RepID=A0ABT7L9G7_9BACI|nr:mechanosensitive ion channel domain-containing protein [Aquibacillus sp. LR5S19]MDL4841835.1 mechanosensitive ion channel [Aquibacillus sp. LR5S19]